MDLVFLAAGFATRLEPLTLDQPKHLLPIKNGLFVDRLMDQLKKVDNQFNRKVLITNGRYFDSFNNWKQSNNFEIDILNDGVRSKDEKIGAIGDLLEAIKQADLRDDLLVLAMDFIFVDFDFEKFLDFANEKKSSVIVVRTEEDVEEIKAGSAVEVDEDDLVVRFEEKPKNPFSNLYGVPYYLIKKEDLGKIAQIDKSLWDNCGQIAAKLTQESKLFAYRFDGDYLHMTNLNDYNRIKNL